MPVPPDEILTTSGTWTKPAGAGVTWTKATITVIGGGGGGSAGGFKHSGGGISGGCGGGGAGIAGPFEYDHADLDATEVYVVGAGGAGAPRVDAVELGPSQPFGGDGEDSYFVVSLLAFTQSAGGGKGGAGYPNNFGGDGGSTPTDFDGGDGGFAGTSTLDADPGGDCAGGGGGGDGSSSAPTLGGAGGDSPDTGGGLGGLAPGSNGDDAADPWARGGGGAGSDGVQGASESAPGGDGGLPGGGGGGSGGTRDPSAIATGKGGDGARGQIHITYSFDGDPVEQPRRWWAGVAGTG